MGLSGPLKGRAPIPKLNWGALAFKVRDLTSPGDASSRTSNLLRKLDVNRLHHNVIYITLKTLISTIDFAYGRSVFTGRPFRPENSRKKLRAFL